MADDVDACQWRGTRLPRHVAIVMDRQWSLGAATRPARTAGIRRREGGAASGRACAERGIEVLTLFAFSSENWLGRDQKSKS